MLIYVTHDNTTLAIIVKNNFSSSGIEFFTPEHFSQQLGYMNRPEGYVIMPHVHNTSLHNVQITKEVLFIKSGKVRVDFYTEKKDYVESRILNSGDVILLAYGGHGFLMLEPSEIIEVKQGPYVGESDKTRFLPVNEENIWLRGEIE